MINQCRKNCNDKYYYYKSKESLLCLIVNISNIMIVYVNWLSHVPKVVEIWKDQIRE